MIYVRYKFTICIASLWVSLQEWLNTLGSSTQWEMTQTCVVHIYNWKWTRQSIWCYNAIQIIYNRPSGFLIMELYKIKQNLCTGYWNCWETKAYQILVQKIWPQIFEKWPWRSAEVVKGRNSENYVITGSVRMILVDRKNMVFGHEDFESEVRFSI